MLQSIQNPKILAIIGTPTREYDWQHWQQRGWLEGNYYYPVQINPLANACAAFIERMIDRAIRNVSVKPVT